MKLRLYNAKILTMEDLFVTDGEVHVEDSVITYVGAALNQQQVAKEEFLQQIDCEGNLLMPGLKNAHAHGPMTFLRSYADDMNLQDWLYQQVFPAEAKLKEEDIYWLHKLAILEYLTSGITTSFEMYFMDDGIVSASKELGYRTVLCGAVVGNDMTWLNRLEQKFTKDYESDLISYQLGFHAEYSTDRALLEGVAALAKKYQAPVFTHCQETQKETDDCIAKNGLPPMQYLAQLGMFDYGGGLYHMVHLAEGDLELLRQKQIAVVTNPGSNCKLASGIAPLTEYDKHGVLLGIGTDGPASNNCLDMFWEMHLASALQKIDQKASSAMPAEAVLTMATVNNAKLMGLEDCSSLTPGKKADIIMIDLKKPNMQPLQNIPKNLVYSGSKDNVLMTMVGGQILYHKGIFASHIQVDEIYRQVEDITRRVKQELNS